MPIGMLQQTTEQLLKREMR